MNPNMGATRSFTLSTPFTLVPRSRECPVQYPVATIGVKWEKTTVITTVCDYSVPLSTQYEF